MKRGGYLRRESKSVSRPGRLSRAQENRIYLRRAKIFKLNWIEEHGPWCPVARAVSNLFLPITDVHHKAGREGPLLLDERHWMCVSRWGHDWIRDHGREAHALGWIYEATIVGLST